jgi:hypothetical protein
VATVVRFISVPRRWLAMFFIRTEAPTPAEGGGTPETILPAGYEVTAAGPETEPRAGGPTTPGALRPCAAVGLAALAAAASRLIVDRRRRARETDQRRAPGRRAEGHDEPGEATVRI